MRRLGDCVSRPDSTLRVLGSWCRPRGGAHSPPVPCPQSADLPWCPGLCSKEPDLRKGPLPAWGGSCGRWFSVAPPPWCQSPRVPVRCPERFGLAARLRGATFKLRHLSYAALGGRAREALWGPAAHSPELAWTGMRGRVSCCWSARDSVHLGTFSDEADLNNSRTWRQGKHFFYSHQAPVRCLKGCQTDLPKTPKLKPR